MKRTLILAGAIVVAGCTSRPGGLQDALSYDRHSLTHVAMDDDTYRVFEHPQRDRIMTTTSLGLAASQGLARGATLGIARPQTPEQRHEAAARKHLDETERSHCRIVSGYELVQTQYEFKIECAELDGAQRGSADD